ncbi:YpdA family putative bacillithiol disulfide reductase [Flavobacteriaceae bacterium]|jgi:thioredoxin reductase (NADPH)|nr:YpdA family putative bacillithiol disulfide reductase [Flavobacteriaceae bacterium]MDA9885980.1 YpdA family putative bacillithiol disulfide reductase [Flavobacteriaceae bacterium]MDB4186842.1 YpdA family putative bacillithiol disulfide reductase [Flavobacteriaceae bacterium]
MKDLIIIGAGPIGLACGIEAKKNKLDYLILDKGMLVNSLYHYPQNMTFFSTSDRLEIGGIPFISHNPKPTRAEALEYYRRVTAAWELNVKLYEGVDQFEKTTDGFIVHTPKGSYTTKNIVMATGFYDLPYLLNVKGENLPKVSHYYKEPHPYFGMDLVVVGAANSAVDVALETYRKGAKSVTLVVREKEVGKNVKYWARPDIVNRIEEGSIKAFFEAELKEIKPSSVVISSANETLEIANDFVLAMTGYQPDFSLLESLGVAFHSDEYQTPVYDESTMESNQKGIYLAGVVCGGLKTNKWFIENSRIHAPQIIKAILENLN